MGNVEKEAGKNIRGIKIIETIIAVIISVGTLLIAYFSYLNNSQLGKLNGKLDGEKFAYDRIERIYDRVERYIRAEKQSESWGNALIVLIGRIPNEKVSQNLLSIMASTAKNENVSTDAIIIRNSKLSNDQKNTQAGNFKSGFLFDEGGPGKTDMGVYVCRNTKNRTATVSAAEDLMKKLRDSQKYGKIIGKTWRSEGEVLPVSGTITFIIDKKHAEKNELDELEKITGKVMPQLEFQKKFNSGTFSPWWITAIVCG